MKKIISSLMLVAALSGCDDANQLIDKAQETANSAVDTMQEKMESVDLSKLNLDQLGGAAASAQQLAESVDEALNADFSDPEMLTEVHEHISNAYSCLVEASSESTAEKLMDKVMVTISNEDAKTLIEKSIEKAKQAQECVM